MKKLMTICVVAVLIAFAGNVDAATYYNVGEWGAGPLEPNFVSWNPDFVLAANYRIVQFNWSVTNNGSITYTDVKMVLPFVWDSGSPLPAYDWIDASNEWVISDQGNGFDLVEDGCYAKLPTVSYAPSPAPPTESRMLMSDTDLPLFYSYSGYETATVSLTDSVPDWAVTASLAPTVSVSFSTYIQVERGAGISAFYTQPYMVSTVPEPATLCVLLIGALLGVLGKRRRA